MSLCSVLTACLSGDRDGWSAHRVARIAKRDRSSVRRDADAASTARKFASIASRSGHRDALFETTATSFGSGAARFGSDAGTPACNDARSPDQTVRRLTRQHRRLVRSRHPRAVPARRITMTVVRTERPGLPSTGPHDLVAMHASIAHRLRSFPGPPTAAAAAPRGQIALPACLLIRSLVPGIATVRRLAVQHRPTTLPIRFLTMLSRPRAMLTRPRAMLSRRGALPLRHLTLPLTSTTLPPVRETSPFVSLTLP